MKLLEILRGHGAARPDAPAYRCGGETLTYGALCAQSDALAEQLAREAPEGPVAVYGGHGILMPVCFLACLKAGRAYIPFQLGTPPGRIRRAMELAHGGLLLAAESFLGKFCPVWDADELRRRVGKQGPAPQANAVSGGDTAYILFTSGSTGDPKGVRVTADNLDGFTEWAAALLGGGTVHGQAPFSFDLSVMSLYPAFYTGGCSAWVDDPAREDFAALFAQMRAADPDVWISTPSFAQFCLRDGGFGADLLPHLKKFVFCGETLRPSTASQILERFQGCKVFNTYGPTEATVAVTAMEVALEDCAGPLPAGRAKPGVTLQIVDRDGCPLPDGERGEVAILGDSVAAGYLDERENSAFGLVEDGRRRYRTGDLGALRDGVLWLYGRTDRQIKLHGYRIEPGDIENNLLRLPLVEDCAVLPKRVGGRVCSLTAFVVLAKGERDEGFDTVFQIRRALRELLPDYLLPKRIVVLAALPLTGNGKLDRVRLEGLL